MEIQMQRKFLELKQENMSVAEYEAKFTELSRFVPQLVGTEEKKAERFQQGLKQWIQNKLAILEITDYATLVQKATIAETKPVTCFKCGKVGHSATTCNQEAAKCFQCGKTGHMKKDYSAAAPASSRGSVAASNRVPTARTFNMTVKDAMRNTNVITGTLLLNSNPANVLFDSGATKSFVSKEFAEKLNLKVEPLKESLQVEIANQEIILVNQVYANCNLELGGVRCWWILEFWL
ncbi:uncharacterized protein LOC141665459 [Apium graveolens]|uniref:uncharacterized protein LOC141665459 n=1 Tax=Apium graveolens TaxID=4045 RepID=UPI003D79AEBD